MKIKFTLLVCALIATASLLAQDIIVTNDAQKIEAKILEVSNKEIKYKEQSNLDGPTFIMETKEISSIIYSNGKVVLYNQRTQSESKQEVHSQTPANAPTVEESMAEILLISGQTMTVQITDMKSDYVAYIQDETQYRIPSSQINKVTFLQTGQVREYGDKIVEQNMNVSQKESSAEPKSGRIYRDNGHYMCNDIYIASAEVERILKRENAAAYEKWKKAEGMLIGGSVCAGIGGGLVIGGLVSLFSNPMVCISMECAALVPLGIGLGLTLGSSAHFNQAIDIYNAKYDQAEVQLKWHVAPNEVGLALVF